MLGGRNKRASGIAAHALALLAVIGQICLVVLCECGLSASGDTASGGGLHAHHGAHAGHHEHGGAPSGDDCNACRVTCGSTALFTAFFVLLALALIPLRREDFQHARLWARAYSGEIFDGRAPPLSV